MGETIMKIEKMTEEHLDECVNLFTEVFSEAPWYDLYSSRRQVVDFFQNYFANNFFVGFVLKDEGVIAALSLGAKKPWIDGLEYYIDQFCVKTDLQGKGVGSRFINLIEKAVAKEGMNAIMLNTDEGFPAEQFYLKNGFTRANALLTLIKPLDAAQYKRRRDK